MGSIIQLKGTREAPKSSQNRMETQILTADGVANWVIPPFQRPLRVNQKVMEIAEQIKESESIEGVLTLGRITKDPSVYIIDGQHRIEAFKISGAEEVLADVRFLVVDSMAELSEEFVRLNSSIVKMRPDDILRGLESSIPFIAGIKKGCDFVGYDQIRRGTAGPILSMSIVIRCWAGSSGETPSSNTSGQSVVNIARSMDLSNQQSLIGFLSTAHAAWGRDPEYYRLWGALNMTICMWLWRRLVMDRDRSGGKRYVALTVTEFKQCLMALSANEDFPSWLVGRNMGERDRSPCYLRIKSIFVRRLTDLFRGDKKKTVLPAPAWASK